jgi:hypothetical protein
VGLNALKNLNLTNVYPNNKKYKKKNNNNNGLSRICFEMTRQATMPSSKA